MKRIIIILLICLSLSACSFDDDFSDSYLYTTMYPIEYAANELYSEYAKIESVYPNDATNEYKVTDKKKNKYSKGETFIYSGVAKEAYLAKDILNLNNKIKLIDATKGMNTTANINSSWLDPSNYLMLCSNIKSGLIEYNDNVYVKDKIADNYKLLNEKISKLDVKLFDIGKNGNYNTLLVTDDTFNFLEKYNIKIISIDSNNSSIDKSYAEAKKYISNKKIQYIYSLSDQVLTEAQEKFITENSLVKVQINNLFTLSDSERKDGKDYLSLMEEIIDNYKKELYKN